MMEVRESWLGHGFLYSVWVVHPTMVPSGLKGGVRPNCSLETKRSRFGSLCLGSRIYTHI
ncbi:hypothetical protein HanRHA438_Chr15g0701311 [Helianthus annuus]|nr:hypothetical protein HanRHA438_Chr15g0701311 [Helianthus annuus]